MTAKLAPAKPVEHLYQITLFSLCFGILVRGDTVVRAAPVAKWAVGKPWATVREYWVKRGATIIFAV